MYLAFRIGPLLGSFLESVTGKLHHFQSKFYNQEFPAISTVKPLHLNATEGKSCGFILIIYICSKTIKSYTWYLQKSGFAMEVDITLIRNRWRSTIRTFSYIAGTETKHFRFPEWKRGRARACSTCGKCDKES